MPAEAALFDLDMTLVDSSPVESYRRAHLWNHVKRELGRVKPFEVEDGPAPHELPAAFRKKGIPVGIVTSSPRWYAETILSTFKIHYDCLVAFGDTEEHKPDPAPIELAIKTLGVSANMIFHVGDDLIDTEAAYHAGVFSVGAGWSLNGSGNAGFMQQAPEITFWKPSHLLDGKMDRHRYLGEAIHMDNAAIWHKGSTLWWTTNGRRIQCLGRYMKGEDARHADHGWTEVVLKNKNDDTHCELLGQVLAKHLNLTNYEPTSVVCVPPKPGQRNRFTELMKVCDPLLEKDIQLFPDGLKCDKLIEGYKAMGFGERSEAIKGTFSTNRKWSGKVLLLDDVYTTGATSEECERVLRLAGAASVRPVAFGLTQSSMERKFCPACHRAMKIRTQRSTGTRFWGCSGYPDHCKNTVPL